MGADCTACILHADALNVCVRSRGTGKILIVGQNPGQEENFANEAFVGKSGQLLDAMLSDAGFNLDDIRRTNVVRCVTPKNRPPLPSEAAACHHFLVEEILEVAPTVIIAMGDVAYKALTGLRSALSSVRGQEQALAASYGYECGVWATYHPAYVLRSPMARATVVSDLQRVRDRHMKTEELDWEYWNGDPIIEKAISYDIETYDESGKLLETPTQIAFAIDSKAFVTSHPKDVSRMIHALDEHGCDGWELIGANSNEFDDPKTGLRSNWDIRAIFYLLDETQPLNLESLAVKYLGVCGWKEQERGFLGTNELAEYNARDAIYTLRLFRKGMEELGGRKRIIEEIIRPARWALDSITKRGIYINGQTVERHRVRVQADLDERLERLMRELDACEFPRDRFNEQLKTKVKEISFNPGSNRHVGTVIADHLGFPLPMTKGGKDYAVGADQLVHIDHSFVHALRDHREVTKRMNTYIEPYAEIAATGDGRAHPFYKLTSVVTGRSSASGPNTQNIDRSLQDMKDAPPGKVLTSADYASIEFRMGAFIANERTVIKNYNDDPNWDPHTWFAMRLYDKTAEEIAADVIAKKIAGLEDSMRQIAKSANFSQEYEGVGHTLRAYAAREMGIFLTEEMADRTHVAWHRAMPDWKPWYGRTWDEYLKNGYVETPTGMRRHFGDVSLLNYYQRQEARRELVNFQVQSFCACIAKLALRFCHEASLPMVDFVHDDIKFEFDSMEQAIAREPEIQRCMVDEPLRILRDVFGCVPTVPLVLEIKHKQGLHLAA